MFDASTESEIEVAVSDVMLQVKETIVVNGLAIDPGEYEGIKLSDRPDTNSAGGRRTDWELVHPQPLAPNVPTTGRVNLTEFVRDGRVVEID